MRISESVDPFPSLFSGKYDGFVDVMNMGGNFHKGAAFFRSLRRKFKGNVKASTWVFTHLVYRSIFQATSFVGFSLLRLPSSFFFFF